MRNPVFRIVLVEDNAADVYLLRHALVTAGVEAELTVIEDGAQALAFVKKRESMPEAPDPDLFVLDLYLPRNGGVEVLEAIRLSAHLAHMPVAVISSSVPPSEQVRVAQLGIARFIAKPPELEEFLRIGEVVKLLLLKNKAAGATPAQQTSGAGQS